MQKLEQLELGGIWNKDLKIERSQRINIIHDICNNQLIIEKIERRCFFCQSEKHIKRYKDRFICEECLNEIKAM